jgi:ABC-type nitrate/sulfonate/bicarbonate transport system permease component
MTVIGLSGYLLDVLFRQIQNRLLWWQPMTNGGGT